MIEQTYKGRWRTLGRTTPSGKILFQCLICERESPTPDKRCDAGCEVREDAMKELDTIIDEIAEAAKTTLRSPANIVKPDWAGYSESVLFSRAEQELHELEESLKDPENNIANPKGSSVFEGGDVLNFMAMSIHNRRRASLATIVRPNEAR